MDDPRPGVRGPHALGGEWPRAVAAAIREHRPEAPALESLPEPWRGWVAWYLDDWTIRERRRVEGRR